MSSILTKWRLTKKRALLFALLILSYTQGITQVLQSNRFELSLAKEDNSFEVISSQADGIFLHRRWSTLQNDRLELIKIDTAFNITWQGYLDLDKKFILMGKRAAHDYLFLLMRFQDASKKDMELFAIQQSNGKYLKYTIRNIISFVPTEFQVTKYAALIGGYFNQVPVVIYFPFDTQKTKILPGLFNELGELTQIKTYEDGAFDILISAKNHSNQKTIWIKNYDQVGNLLRNIPLQPEDNKHLIFARSVKTSNNMQLVAGVYGGRQSEFSKGLFIASIDPTGLQQVKYYSYGDLENFFKYMKAKREQRVKSRIERRKIRGKKIRFNYRFMVHELVPYKDQFVLLGEAFYPKYKSLDRSSYGGFFNPYSFSQGAVIRDGRIFDGYHYTHAVVMGFDKNGEVIWDNSFEINDVKTFTLEQFVKLEAQEDKISLLYLFDNQLRSKIIKDNEVLEGKTAEPLKTKLENEKVKQEASGLSKLDYWYHNYFFAYGVQEIAHPQFGKRRVFFINKLQSK